MSQSFINHLFHQMKIGDRASLSRHVSSEDIALFATVSGDANPAILMQVSPGMGPLAMW